VATLLKMLVIGFWLIALNFSIFFNRCAGAGHIRDDILYYIREFEKFTDDDDEERAYLFDMGIKALRYITFTCLANRNVFLVPTDEYQYISSKI